MQAGWVLEKTALGRGELATHAHHLSPLVRGVLVLVNGQRNVAGLLDCATDRQRWHEAIVQLLEHGFVQPLNVPWPDDGMSVSQAEALRTHPASVGGMQASSLASMPAGAPEHGDLRAMLTLLATQMFGKQAEKLLQKLQAADNTVQGQRAAVEGCVKFIRLFVDEKKATEFQRKAETLIASGTTQV